MRPRQELSAPQRAAMVQSRMAYEDCYESLIARGAPMDVIEPGRAYVIHARNGGVGVAVEGPQEQTARRRVGLDI